VGRAAACVPHSESAARTSLFLSLSFRAASSLLLEDDELTKPRKRTSQDASTDPDRKRPSSFDFDSLAKRARYDEPSPSTDDDQRPAFVRPQPNTSIQRRSRALPDGWHVDYDRESDRDLFINMYTGARQRDRPSGPAPQRPPQHFAQSERARPPAPVLDANELIKQAEAQAREALEAEERRAKAEREARDAEKSERAERKRAEKEEKGARVKDKMVMGLFSTVVVNTMSKYKGEFEPDAFKKRAREVRARSPSSLLFLPSFLPARARD